MSVITSAGIPFGGSKVNVGTTVAEIVATQDVDSGGTGKGIPVITSLQLRPVSGQTIELEFFDGSTSTTILKTPDDLDLENLDLFGEAGDSIRIKGSSGTTGKVVVAGHSRRILPNYGQRLWKYATVADTTGGAFATLYDTPATETIVIQRAIAAGVIANEIQIGYADDATGANFVPVALGLAEWINQEFNFVCPKGKKILLWGTDGIATPIYGLFSGVKI